MAQRSTQKNFVTKFLELICGALVAVMVVLLSIQVIGRYLVDSPPDWTEELARVVFVYATFFGGAIAVQRKAHLCVDILGTALSVRAGAILQIVLKLISVIALAIIVWYGYAAAQRLAGQPLTSVPVSKGFMFAAVPLGCILILFYEIARIIDEGKKVLSGVDHNDHDVILPHAEAIIHQHEGK
jgi:TRAP-type C4-dicarboxylate transport system permease small subunit